MASAPGTTFTVHLAITVCLTLGSLEVAAVAGADGSSRARRGLRNPVVRISDRARCGLAAALRKDGLRDLACARDGQKQTLTGGA